MAETQTLTKRVIDALRLPAGKAQLDVYDSSYRGLVLRVGKKRKTWIYRYRVPGRKHAQVLKLGLYPQMDLKAARNAAALGKAGTIKGGRRGHPAEERRRLRAAESIDDLAELYLKHHAGVRKKEKSRLEDEKMLRRDVLPAWDGRKAAEIRRPDVIALLDEVVARGAGVKANRLRALLSKMFNFAIARALLENNPVAGVPKQVEERPRERCLSESEIRALWAALDAFPSEKIRDAYRLMLLTGQREGEVIHMEWSEVNFEGGGWWTIPAERSKTHRLHRVPLTSTALATLERRKRAALPGARFVFPGVRKGKPLSYLGKRHARIKQDCGFDFQPRDLRRTAGTHIASMVGRFVVARILGHADRAITGVYDKYDYDSEKRAALIKWDARLREIVTGEPAPKVVELRPAAA